MKNIRFGCVVFAMGAFPFSASAYEISKALNVYGNLNVGIEYRMVDDINNQDLGYDDHFELQDAYSGIGVKGEHDIEPGLTAFYDYKVSLDLGTGKLGESDQTSWEGVSDVEENVAKVGLKGKYGAVSVGRMWNAYYNRVSYTTDHFSSGWTGFDTYAAFQLNRMLTYQSPAMDGFSFAVNIKLQDSKAEDAEQDRYIFGATYSLPSTTLNFGFDNLGDNPDLFGFSIAHTIGALTLSGKFESLVDGASDGGDANLATILVEYVAGKNTFKFHVAEGDYPAYLGIDDDEGSEIGIGVDHAINQNLYLFAEYHTSDDYCAYDITENGLGNGSYSNGIAGLSCSVLTTGVHYSF